MRVEQKTKIRDARGERSEPKMREGERRRKYWCERKKRREVAQHRDMVNYY